MKIFAGHDGGSGCAHYRIKVPLEELNRHDGFDVTFRDAGDSQTGVSTLTLRDLQGYDVIVGQRFNRHEGMGVWRQARTPFSRLVYDLDDDVFTISPENWQAFNLYNRADIRDAVTHLAEVSDRVTVSTPYLAGVMSKYNPAVTVLPNCIPGWVCDTVHPRRDRPAIGWQGGASHGADVGLIVNPVRRFLKRFPGWDLRLAGTDYRPTFKVGDRATYSYWVPVYEDAAGFYGSMDFDIGLCPLADTPFNRSKSAIKALEYMALGIPVIASDVEPYRTLVIDGVNGFLIRYEHEWLKRMSELVTDVKLRETMAEAGLVTARAHSIENNWQLWADTYTSMFPAVK